MPKLSFTNSITSNQVTKNYPSKSSAGSISSKRSFRNNWLGNSKPNCSNKINNLIMPDSFLSPSITPTTTASRFWKYLKTITSIIRIRINPNKITNISNKTTKNSNKITRNSKRSQMRTKWLKKTNCHRLCRTLITLIISHPRKYSGPSVLFTVRNFNSTYHHSKVYKNHFKQAKLTKSTIKIPLKVTAKILRFSH